LVGHFLLNVLNLADHALNTLLLGDSDETVSARVARARNAGHHWAAEACRLLSWCVKIISFGKIDHDHCQAALDKMVMPDTGEIWNWCDNSINHDPKSVIQIVDVGEDSNNTPYT
jgi:hypothetical protein